MVDIDVSVDGLGVGLETRHNDASAWSAEVNGSPENVVGYSTALGAVTGIELANPISAGDSVTLSYVPPPYDTVAVPAGDPRRSLIASSASGTAP